LFLFAAQQMGFDPEQILIIEDSIAGVRAGVAANMRVLGYVGTSHMPEHAAVGLKAAGASVILTDLRDILKFADL
jgi:beta-phosphoglucomutase-like phosphatase (HAD superfamily)